VKTASLIGFLSSSTCSFFKALQACRLDSIFRHKHDDTPRNRALGVLSNVFLHLHPAKINRDAVRYSYTWGMGGITFYLFIVLTLTGVLLMFYYHPSKVQAFPMCCTSNTTFLSANCCATCIAGPRT